MIPQVYFSLLVKQWNGHIEPEELLELENWLRESPEHSRLAAEYQQAWNLTEQAPLTDTTRFDLDADFEKVWSKIQAAEQPVAKIVQVSWGARLLRVAAAVAVVACATWAYFNLNQSENLIVETADNVDKKEVVLPDGTKVWLRRGAKLEHSTRFAEGKTRCVTLHGEAYFSVTHDASQHFCVATDNGAQVEVLGTEFNVSSSVSATTVVVKSGKVRFSPDTKQTGTVLTTGQKAIFNGSNRIQVSNLTSFNDLAWQRDGLEFSQTPLSQVVADLNAFYNVNIELENNAMATCPYTAPLIKQPVEEVIQSLVTTYHFESKSAQGKIVLSGGICQ